MHAVVIAGGGTKKWTWVHTAERDTGFTWTHAVYTKSDPLPLQLNAALCWVCGSSHQFHHKMSNIWPEIKGLKLQFHQHATCCYFTEAVGSDAAPKSGKKNKIWVQLSIHSSCDHAVTKIVFCERQSKKIAGGNAMVTITHRGNIFRIPNWSCAKGDSSLMKAKLSVSEWFKIRFHF